MQRQACWSSISFLLDGIFVLYSEPMIFCFVPTLILSILASSFMYLGLQRHGGSDSHQDWSAVFSWHCIRWWAQVVFTWEEVHRSGAMHAVWVAEMIWDHGRCYPQRHGQHWCSFCASVDQVHCASLYLQGYSHVSIICVVPVMHLALPSCELWVEARFS